MRIRIKFSKSGGLRFIGHLDLHKIWERSTRRADIPLLYSQGFHPQPKIQIACALPLGFASNCELVDLWVDGTPDLFILKDSLSKAVPPGLKILDVENVDEKGPPLQTQVQSAEYKISLDQKTDIDSLRQKVEECNKAEKILRERRGKPYDLRPLIELLEVNLDDLKEKPQIHMILASREGATGRPEEVLDFLGIPFDETYIERIHLIFKT